MAERLLEAQNAARQELASVLRVRVRGSFTSQTTLLQTAQVNEGRKVVQNLVETQADLDLEGLDRMETWTDPRSGEVHALAVLDRTRAAGLLEARLKAQALLHGSYLEMGKEVSLLLRLTALTGEELASSQVRLDRAWIDQAGLRLLPENHAEAAQSLAILDTEVAPPGLRLNVQLDRGDGGIYRKDEPLFVFLKADRDCYVRVVYQQVDGTRIQVLPNRYHPEAQLRAGVTLRIPGPGDAFERWVTEPFGSEIVKVFASTEPFELAPATAPQEGPFTRLEPSMRDLTARFRGIRVDKAKAQTAEATAVVNTVDLPRR